MIRYAERQSGASTSNRNIAQMRGANPAGQRNADDADDTNKHGFFINVLPIKQKVVLLLKIPKQ
jgi:hypothetical protein